MVKEGNFTRASTDEIDEAEIFEGAENKLTMTQAYTWEFQCPYQLSKYPFDHQVNMIQMLRRVSDNCLTSDVKTCFRQLFSPQECLIIMNVESQTSETVKLLANEVNFFKKNIKL